jgi:hypothetical protein
MKAEELRIGNWVEIKDQEVKTYAQVEGLGNLQHVAGQLWSIEELEPIPLTEEWLTRFGWNPPKDISVSFSLTTNDIHFVAGNYYKKIQHVHQLQNLFYCLCGQELTLKQIA